MGTVCAGESSSTAGRTWKRRIMGYIPDRMFMVNEEAEIDNNKTMTDCFIILYKYGIDIIRLNAYNLNI